MTTQTSGRFRSADIGGEFARYDGTNTAEIEAFAGGQYEGPGGDGNPVVRDPGGNPCPLGPGWVLSRPEGAGVVHVHSPEAWAAWAREAA